MIQHALDWLETPGPRAPGFELDAIADSVAVVPPKWNLHPAAGLQFAAERLGHQIIKRSLRTGQKYDRGNELLLLVVRLPGGVLRVEQSLLLPGHGGGWRV